jgi:hypothetical protein
MWLLLSHLNTADISLVDLERVPGVYEHEVDKRLKL